MIKTLSAPPLVLAYVGDAVYELHVRMHCVKKYPDQGAGLHKKVVARVNAHYQADMATHWLDTQILTEQEHYVFRRARNHRSGSIPKNVRPIVYKTATAFEAVIGYLYLEQQHARIELLLGDLDRISRKTDGLKELAEVALCSETELETEAASESDSVV